MLATTPALSIMSTVTVPLAISCLSKVLILCHLYYMHVPCYSVTVPPMFVDPPSPFEIVAGGNITITCNATGVPIPEVNILRDGVPFSIPGTQTSSGVLSDGVEYFSVSVTLSNLNYTDSAEYYCNATNNLAAVRTSTSSPSQYTVYCKS